MDIMEGKPAMTSNQDYRCLTQQSQDVMIPPRHSNATLTSSRSTLGLIIVLVLLLVLCISICFLSLSAVFVLSNKVQTLEARVDELCQQKGQSATNFDSKSTHPMASTYRETKNDQIKNVSVEEKVINNHKVKTSLRTPRQTATTDTQCQGHCHTVSHISGRAVNNNCSGHRWISWHTPSTNNNYDTVARDGYGLELNTFLPIHQSGYYYIYGQLTYHNTNIGRPYGFEIVRITCHEHQSILLQTRTTQAENTYNTQHSTTDSSYVGGAFQLESTDLIAIRKKRGNHPGSNFNLYESLSDEIDTLNFFGAFKLSSAESRVSGCSQTYSARAHSLCS
ncbi:uncharacterized protein [Amphiura filiformis]|uniref:uncharacterized protein n=1 Tax=Amphiura filiformis TaxID=82378 RepID=UPI003B222386